LEKIVGSKRITEIFVLSIESYIMIEFIIYKIMVQSIYINIIKVQVMKVKDKILELRALGYSYKKIQDEIKCSKGTIAYHCGEGQKEKYAKRRKSNRSKRHPLISKIENFIYDKYYKPVLKNRHVHTLHKNLKIRIESFSRVNKEYAGMEFTIKDFLDKVGDNPICSLTGKPIDLMKPRTYQLDHIIPRSKGGENTLNNCQLVLKEVNLAKHTLSSEEFVKLCREVVDYHDKKTKHSL
jgi:5-methylcytosine-specific restriction endonuclease McrA